MIHCQHPRQAPDTDIGSIVKDLVLQVSEIAKEVNSFKAVAKNQKHDENTLDDIVTNNVDNSSPNIEQTTPPLDSEADATPPSNDELNESFASIEEFMDAETNEIDEDVQAFLNLNPTTQP